MNKSKISKDFQPIILAGGLSTRMGMPKALLNWHNTSMLEHIYNLSIENFEQLPIVIANDENIISNYPYEFFSDIHPHLGPLAGLETACTYASSPYIFLLACDMPLLCGNFFQDMVKTHAKTYAEALIPLLNENIEPLAAIYDRKILPQIKLCLQQNNLSLRSLLKLINTKFFDASNYEECFYNLNTPTEFANLKQKLFAK